MAQLYPAARAALVLALTLLCGCKSEPPEGTVKGEVTLDGQPVGQGHVQFFPLDGKSRTAGGPIENGKFSELVPVGEMRVEIIWPKPTGKKHKLYDAPNSPEKDIFAEAIPERYNVKSELKITVKPGLQTERFDLKTK